MCRRIGLKVNSGKSKAMVLGERWEWSERSRIRAVQMDNLRCLLGIKRMEACGVTKRVDERIDEGVFRWFGHVERMGC